MTWPTWDSIQVPTPTFTDIFNEAALKNEATIRSVSIQSRDGCNFDTAYKIAMAEIKAEKGLR